MTRFSPRSLGAVALGGALGSVLRWAVGELVPVGAGFPWTTFAINVSGSLALALVLAWSLRRDRPLLVLFLAPGFLGGFTTLSAYAEQGRALLAAGEPATALAYLLGTLVVAVGAVALASREARR